MSGSTRRRLAALTSVLLTLSVAVACRHDDKPGKHAAAGLALPPDDGSGEIVCPQAPGGRFDRWSYRARVTAAAGLELQNLSFGPRLVARSITVPYVRIRVGDAAPKTALLSRAPAAGADVASTLVGAVKCMPEDGGEGATGLSATYRLSVPVDGAAPITVLIQQSYRFDATLDKKCEPTMTAVCRRFWPTATWAVPGAAKPSPDVTVSVVQRFAFDPDGASETGAPGAGDLVRDIVKPNSKDLIAVDDLGSEGRLANAGVTKVIDGGVVGDAWESWHQTGRAAVGMPGLIPGSIPDLHIGHVTGTAGCSECVHAHWSWFAAARRFDENTPEGSILMPGVPALAVDAVNILSCRTRRCWTDGKPQILEGSRQTVCAGWTTRTIAETVDWCAATGQEPLDPARPPVFYWDATSSTSTELSSGVSIGGTDYAYGDSSWPVLRKSGGGRNLDRSHGGNGSMFVVPARRLSVVREATSKEQAVVSSTDGSTTDAGIAVHVRITLGDPHDQGPYYLRVRTVPGLTLNNPDPLWSPASGGAPWVRATKANGKIALAYEPADGPLTAVLLLNRKPQRGELAFELDAAPDGISGYSLATGDWPAPQLDATAWDQVDWKQQAWDALGCERPDEAGDWFKPENTDVDPPVYADVTGDGRAEAIVAASCPAITAGWPTRVFVFDGGDPVPPLTRLLTSGTDLYSMSAKVTTGTRTITIAHSALGPNAPRCCPDLLVTERYEWTGHAFTRKSRIKRALN